MSVKRLTARERFVEAMQTITDGIPLQAFGKMMAAVRQAVEAFADAKCGPDAACAVRARKYVTAHITKKQTEQDPGTWYRLDSARRVIEHAVCRAALLKEVGLHGSERSDE